MATLILDTAAGAEIEQGIQTGKIVRTGLIIGLPLGVFGPNQFAVQAALDGVAGMPALKSVWDSSDPIYSQYFLKRRIARAINANHAVVMLIYEYYGLLTVSDTSSIQSVTTQLHPKDFTPLYVYYTPIAGLGDPAPQKITKLVNLQSALPLRHLTVSQTIPHMASSDIIDAFKTVNSSTWQGLPAGYWLFSAIDGYTQDDGLTYTYSATFTTKETENWLQLGFMEDDTGQPVFVPPATVAGVRALPYFYGKNNTVDGILVAGMYDLADFFSIFGI